MNEEWRDVVGYEGVYQVSNLGQVKRIAKARGARPGHILTPCFNQYGYQKVTLGRNGKQETIHALVAAAFIGPRPQGKQINHLDGNKTNNRAENLEYITPRGNTRHAIKTLGYRVDCEFGHNRKLERGDIEKIRRLYASGEYKQRELADMFSVHRGHISMIVTHRTWRF